MSESNASSSDLELARVLSHKLALRTAGAAPARAGADEPAPRRTAPGSSSARERGRSSGRPSWRGYGLGAPLEIKSWEVFLAWSLELCRARAGFIVDSQGFVIANRGNIPSGSFDGLGAELCYAMEQLERIDPEAGGLRALELQYEGRRVIGLRADAGKLGVIVVGFVGSKPLGDELREAIVHQLKLSLQDLA